MNTQCDISKVYTVGDWLLDCVNFSVPEGAVRAICIQRGVDSSTEYQDYVSATQSQNTQPTKLQNTQPDIRLLKADLLKWIVLGANKVNNTSDSDNGWSHSEGGYTLSAYDKKLLMDEANGIYDELETSGTFGKRRIRMRSAGIMPAARDLDGMPLQRKPL